MNWLGFLLLVGIISFVYLVATWHIVFRKKNENSEKEEFHLFASTDEDLEEGLSIEEVYGPEIAKAMKAQLFHGNGSPFLIYFDEKDQIQTEIWDDKEIDVE